MDLAARVIAGGAVRRVSVGRAGERYFLLMAGVGLDAEMLRSVHPGLKRLTGEGAYWMAGLRQLADWNPVPFAGGDGGRPAQRYLRGGGQRGLLRRRAVAQGPDSRLVHVDGEPLGRLPVAFDCVPAALSLVVP